MHIEKEHEYSPVDLDEDDLRPTIQRPRLKTWRLVLYIELAHVLLFALIYTAWHLAHRSPNHGICAGKKCVGRTNY
jgi:hypothetical protein